MKHENELAIALAEIDSALELVGLFSELELPPKLAKQYRNLAELHLGVLTYVRRILRAIAKAYYVPKKQKSHLHDSFQQNSDLLKYDFFKTLGTLADFNAELANTYNPAGEEPSIKNTLYEFHTDLAAALTEARVQLPMVAEEVKNYLRDREQEALDKLYARHANGD